MKLSEWINVNALVKFAEVICVSAFILNTCNTIGSMIFLLAFAAVKICSMILDFYAADAAEDFEKEKAHSLRD